MLIKVWHSAYFNGYKINIRLYFSMIGHYFYPIFNIVPEELQEGSRSSLY